MRYTYAYTTHCTHGGDARSVRAYVRSSSVTGGRREAGRISRSLPTPLLPRPLLFPPFGGGPCVEEEEEKEEVP